MASVDISPQPSVEAGSDVEVSVKDPANAGKTVTVDLNNGDTLTGSVQVTLDSSGNGFGSWTVPATGWTIVSTEYPGAASVSTLVTTP